MRGYTRGYSRGNSYRGSSNRGYGGRRESRDSFNSSYESGHGGGGGYENKRFSDRYSRDEYPKAYRMDNYSRHSPERKRMRHEGSSRNEYGGGYESYPVERRGYSRERYPSSSSRREEFRRPPPPSPRGGGGRGRISSRGSRGIRGRERGRRPSGRLLSSRSYGIRKRGMIRPREYSNRGTSRLVRIRSTVRRKKPEPGSDNESEDDETKVKKEDDDEAGEEEDVEMNEGEEKEGEEGAEKKEGEEKKESPKKKTKKVVPKTPERKFIILRCPRCNVKAQTFRFYETHLQTGSHMFNMRKVASKHRTILAQMRNAQRLAQNELEKTADGITDHTVFCPLCKLNYKQERAVHQATAAHKNMRKFLMPSCKICDISFKSPMVYEHHLCSIDHLKKKQQTEEGEPKGDDEDTLDDFTTIDSVGDIVDDNSPDDEEVKKKKKDQVYHGIELIKKVDAWYCDLCRMFLPRCTENESPDIISGHCLKRFHMQRYTRQKENAEMKEKAEKLMREVPKKKKDEVKKEPVEGAEGETAEVEMSEPKEDGKEKLDDDKMWDAVDKDLGELLEETDGKDDDDDVGERFDRFKSTEKEKNGEGAEEDAEKAAEVKTEEAKK